MGLISLILLIFAFCLLMVAAIWNPAPPRPVFGWLGMACWAMAEILMRTPVAR